jgi:hypothetical protein
VAEIAQGLKGRVLRKKFVLPIESWIFTFFTFFWAHGSIGCHLQNVRFLIFFKFFYKVHSVEVSSQDPYQQKEF